MRFDNGEWPWPVDAKVATDAKPVRQRVCTFPPPYVSNLSQPLTTQCNIDHCTMIWILFSGNISRYKRQFRYRTWECSL